jgi:predicted acyltransferase
LSILSIDLPPARLDVVKATRHHVVSLDVFRGVTVAAMIVVNNPGNWGAVFDPLLHSAWNGCTAADLVFPWFLFIMGTAMPWAFARRRDGGATTGRLFRRVCNRAVALIVLGLVLNATASMPHVAAMRLPGVLQRIAVAYSIAAVVILSVRETGQAVVTISLLLVHWALLALVPFGGHAAGVMTQPANLDGYINQKIFGSHMLTVANDPEGLLGTLSAVATVLMGALAGQWMLSVPHTSQRLGGLLAGGAALLALGEAWSTVLPLNKPLWTGSYALVVTGLAMWVLAAAYWVVDVRGKTRGVRPFVWLGINPLAIYFFSELVATVMEWPWIPARSEQVSVKDLVFWRIFAPLDGHVGGAWMSLTFAVCFALIWVATAGVLCRRGVRIQV